VKQPQGIQYLFDTDLISAAKNELDWEKCMVSTTTGLGEFHSLLFQVSGLGGCYYEDSMTERAKIINWGQTAVRDLGGEWDM
jgi:hypothetical protein